MPSERPPSLSINEKISLLSQTKYTKPLISVMNTSKINATAPTLVTTKRAKVRTDTSVIQRPPRKLVLNASHETIMPLSVFG